MRDSTLTTDQHSSGELRLWRAVFGLALLDMALGSRIPDPDREKLVEWVGSPDFRKVCWLAGYDPEAKEEQIRAGTMNLPEGGIRRGGRR